MPELDLKRLAKCLLDLLIINNINFDEVRFLYRELLQVHLIKQNIERAQSVACLRTQESRLVDLVQEFVFEEEPRHVAVRLLRQCSATL